MLVFDVNETLLDLAALDEPFADVFGDAVARQTWFDELLHQAMVSTITGPYVDFAELGASALEAVAQRRGQTLSVDQQHRILGAMTRLPPHDDVHPALQRLQEGGVRMVALSNGPPDTLHAQLRHAELDGYFERIFSADAAQRLKPAPEPYQMVAREMDVPMADLCLVAAHPWDTTGAIRAGARAAFVARPGKHLSAVDPSPEVTGDTLGEVAQRLLSIA